MIGPLFTALISRVAGRRPADFVVGANNPAGAYLLRWYLTPQRGWVGWREFTAAGEGRRGEIGKGCDE